MKGRGGQGIGCGGTKRRAPQMIKTTRTVAIIQDRTPWFQRPKRRKGRETLGKYKRAKKDRTLTKCSGDVNHN